MLSRCWGSQRSFYDLVLYRVTPIQHYRYRFSVFGGNWINIAPHIRMILSGIQDANKFYRKFSVSALCSLFFLCTLQPLSEKWCVNLENSCLFQGVGGRSRRVLARSSRRSSAAWILPSSRRSASGASRPPTASASCSTSPTWTCTTPTTADSTTSRSGTDTGSSHHS